MLFYTLFQALLVLVYMQQHTVRVIAPLLRMECCAFREVGVLYLHLALAAPQRGQPVLSYPHDLPVVVSVVFGDTPQGSPLLLCFDGFDASRHSFFFFFFFFFFFSILLFFISTFVPFSERGKRRRKEKKGQNKKNNMSETIIKKKKKKKKKKRQGGKKKKKRT
eukprot:TRINITY_DN19297_c0_g1_i1.p1 TRINITY_DN19297_c0_g1~~TRINITY_DN19297_c0_g1_i1.p1  ORF type:complete len:164 (-),score=25.23 TRINITY_DN19297_c0_g1_i1:27-518(-)